MIFTWIGLFLAMALLGLTVREWMELGRRTQRMRAEIDHLQVQIAGHTEELSLARNRVDRVKGETADLLRERDDLENEVMEKRRAVTGLEERLERSRPRSHRVDTKDKDDELF